jgi:hypothetical protein
MGVFRSVPDTRAKAQNAKPLAARGRRGGELFELENRQRFTDASLQAKTSRDESRDDEDEEDTEKRMTDPRKLRIDARFVKP